MCSEIRLDMPLDMCADMCFDIGSDTCSETCAGMWSCSRVRHYSTCSGSQIEHTCLEKCKHPARRMFTEAGGGTGGVPSRSFCPSAIGHWAQKRDPLLRTHATAGSYATASTHTCHGWLHASRGRSTRSRGSRRSTWCWRRR